MSRQLTILCAASLVVGVGTILWAAYRRSEPLVHGHLLMYWVEHHWRQEVAGLTPEESPEAVRTAFTEMDHHCVAFLVRELDWKPRRLTWQLNRLARWAIGAEPFHDRPDNREIAAAALAHMGPRAMSAIPALENAAHRNASGLGKETDDEDRGAAIGALILLRQQPVEPLVQQFCDPHDHDAAAHATAIAVLGTNAASAVPLLVKILDATADADVMCRAADALRSIHSRPDLTVPALASLLHDPDHWVREKAVAGLESFGKAGRPAWDALVPCLADPDDLVRQWATSVLLQIDPEAARGLGLK